MNHPACHRTRCCSGNHDKAGKRTTVAFGCCPFDLPDTHRCSDKRASSPGRRQANRRARSGQCAGADQRARSDHRAGRRERRGQAGRHDGAGG